MPTLTDQTDRHTLIDRREGEYICFPDVVRTDDGRLIVAYNESDKHVEPTRRVLLIRTSKDNGRTWDDIVRMPTKTSHCPRLIKRADGEIILSDSTKTFHHSFDNGETWDIRQVTGLAHDMIDRVIDLGNDIFLTTGHCHRGSFSHPAIRQAPAEQMAYRSEDHGATWQGMSVIGRERNLVLCEASMVHFPDGRIIALMRENSFVYEPMYLCISDNEGNTWSDPIPTPLIGHRPTMGVIDDNRLLVTYRNVGPDMGTCAWTGTLNELTGNFKVHGRHENPNNPTLNNDGLRVVNDEGGSSVVRYTLRPLTDPRSATATLETEVRVDQADENGCGLRLGVWWRIFPDRIVPDIENSEPIPIKAGVFNTIQLDYAAGQVTLSVNGEQRTTIFVVADHADTRPILFGAPYPFENNSVDCTWRQVRLSTNEPHLQRKYEWKWRAEDGLPDAWVQDHILELKNDRYAAPPDFGYSGWTTLEDGSIFCTYHHGGGTDKDYTPLYSAQIMGTRFSLDDFKK